MRKQSAAASDANILLYAYDRSSAHNAPQRGRAPTERHWTILSRLLTAGQVSGALVSDAHLSALAIEHGATLVTNDRDFARFPGLHIEYPLMSER